MLGPQDQENYGLREIRPGSRPKRGVFFRKWDPWWYAICDEEGGTVLPGCVPVGLGKARLATLLAVYRGCRTFGRSAGGSSAPSINPPASVLSLLPLGRGL